MNIAVYHPWVYLKGGAERVLLELIRRSRHQWTVFTNHYDPESTFPEFQQFDVRELSRVSVRRSVPAAGHAILTLMTQHLPFENVDALMVSSEGLGNLIAYRTRHIPVFCLCLTPLRVAYDPVTRERYFQARPSPITRTAVKAYTLLDRLTWNSYRRIFCISGEVATRVLNSGLARPQRIEILHPGVDLDAFQPGSGSEPYFLLPGRIMWTKNIELGVDAFLELKRSLPAAAPFRLVVAGMVDRKSRPYLDALRARAQGRTDIQFVECPSDHELRELYQRCYGVLFTAFNEDFGLVALEGMAAGKPVIAVKRGGPLECVLDGVTGLLRPPDPSAFAEALAALIADPSAAKTLGAAGRTHAAHFPWETFVNRIDRYVETLVEQPQAIPAPGQPEAATPVSLERIQPEPPLQPIEALLSTEDR